MPERKEISRPRTCGAAHSSSSSSSSSTSTPKLDDEEKIKQRTELLYPTMKDKKISNDKPKNIKEYNKEYINKLKDFAEVESDKNFLNSLDFLINLEGGYNNIKGDVPTNLGVSQGPHLHLTIREYENNQSKGNSIDPIIYIKNSKN